MATTREPAARRVDAQRNRERLVGAARDLFAAGGVEVSVREIARHAGVGVGTLYRHFPLREELVDAVLEDAFEELVAIAETALADTDSWSGFTRSCLSIGCFSGGSAPPSCTSFAA